MPVVVVLPLVPVTPMSVSRRPGWPYQACAERERRAAAVAHHDLGHARLLRGLDHGGVAPRRTASGTKRWPSACEPRTAT